MPFFVLRVSDGAIITERKTYPEAVTFVDWHINRAGGEPCIIINIDEQTIPRPEVA